MPLGLMVPNHRPRGAQLGSEGKNRLVCRSLQRQVGMASKVSDERAALYQNAMTLAKILRALPVCGV